MIQAQIERIDKLEQQHILPKEELITLLDGQNEALSAYLFSRADAVRRVNYGTDVYVRGLIETPTTAEMTAITAASAVPTQMPAVTG